MLHILFHSTTMEQWHWNLLINLILLFILTLSNVSSSNITTVAPRTRGSSADVRRTNIERMKTATWLNREQVLRSVNFSNPSITNSPYPSATSYDVAIDVNADCYVVFRDPDRTKYDLITASSPDTILGELENDFGIFETHQTPCGACSNLQDLAVYLESPDLTNPVRLCGFTSFLSGQINLQCLQTTLGFSLECATVWLHNTQHTRDNCFLPCILLLLSPNNIPGGGGLIDFNPCEPATENNQNGCENTINHQPVCSAFQYESGRYRLNACLQCDECNSGPLFQRIAGRTRRGSGIKSGIDRPDIPIFNHNYFTTANTRP